MPELATDASPLLAPYHKDSKATKTRSTFLRRWGALIVGPGVMCSLADSDAGCLIVAADSGIRWGYSLVLLQLVLVPVLFAAQEMTVRIGIHTGRGQTACVFRRFGSFWGCVTLCGLMVSCVGALVSEMSGLEAVGQLWGLPGWCATLLAASVLIAVPVLGTYRQVELLAVLLGMGELAFVVTMFLAKPRVYDLLNGLAEVHVDDQEYLKLVAANIGAVIMPWMIFFQQSAVVAKRLTASDESAERAGTLLGTLLTQLIMTATVITMAATRTTIGSSSLGSVSEMVAGLSVVFGDSTAKVLLSIAMSGAALCASFVVALAAAWGISEGISDEPSLKMALDSSIKETPLFYTSYTVVVLFGIGILRTGVSVVDLNIWIELGDSLLMPMTLCFLWLTATGDDLSDGARVTGMHKWVTALAFFLCSVLSLYSGFRSIF